MKICEGHGDGVIIVHEGDRFTDCPVCIQIKTLEEQSEAWKRKFSDAEDVISDLQEKIAETKPPRD